jgi:hypothetical protein
MSFEGDQAETAYHSMKSLNLSQVPDTVQRPIEASLSDRLRRCGLHGSG